jgi:hypothetical protein
MMVNANISTIFQLYFGGQFVKKGDNECSLEQNGETKLEHLYTI